eukprot:5707751-Prymnesium_polylepis.1
MELRCSCRPNISHAHPNLAHARPNMAGLLAGAPKLAKLDVSGNKLSRSDAAALLQLACHAKLLQRLAVARCARHALART